MARYQVTDGTDELWSTTTDEVDTYDLANFPAEYLGNPDSGEVHLIVNETLIGVQRPIGA